MEDSGSKVISAHAFHAVLFVSWAVDGDLLPVCARLCSRDAETFSSKCLNVRMCTEEMQWNIAEFDVAVYALLMEWMAI